MPREALKNDVPELWRQRAKAGLCPVCGKTNAEFLPKMKIYCTPKCRNKYAEKYTYWSEVREKILKRDNETCQECGNNDEKHKEWYKKEEEKRITDWVKNNRKKIDEQRDIALVKLSKQYEEDYEKIMDDVKFVNRNYDFNDEIRDLMKGHKWYFTAIEVDHIKPVAAGGDMWDEANMRCLCATCHKKKTKEDMKLISKIRLKK
jgi:5-methylcytosine-specific restriction endonuclease McrA